jgi:hypothetical protein
MAPFVEVSISGNVDYRWWFLPGVMSVISTTSLSERYARDVTSSQRWGAADIDMVAPASAMAGQRVKEALLILPDHAAKAIEPAWFEEGEQIRVADEFVVDIRLNAKS